MGHWTTGRKGSIVGYVVIHLAYAQVLLCKLLVQQTCGRVRFDLVVQMDFSFNVCPLVTNLMVVMVIVTRGRLQGDGGGSRDQVPVCLDCLLYKFK